MHRGREGGECFAFRILAAFELDSCFSGPGTLCHSGRRARILRVASDGKAEEQALPGSAC